MALGLTQMGKPLHARTMQQERSVHSILSDLTTYKKTMFESQRCDISIYSELFKSYVDHELNIIATRRHAGDKGKSLANGGKIGMPPGTFLAG